MLKLGVIDVKDVVSGDHSWTVDYCPDSDGGLFWSGKFRYKRRWLAYFDCLVLLRLVMWLLPLSQHYSIGLFLGKFRHGR